MRRVSCFVLAFAVVCGLSASAALAGPGCCKSKMDTKDATMSALTSCSMGEFPHMTFLVADQKMDCPSAAEKAAEAKGVKVRFAVAGEEFDCKEKAMGALAENSERYVKRFMSIAAVVDGKLIYCKDELTGCGEARAAADGAGCSKSKATLASAEEGKSCSAKKAEMAKAEGSSCSKSKATLASAEEGKSCSAKKAEMAKAEGSSCSKSKAALASAEEGKSCSKSKTALTADDGASCSKSGAGNIACVSKEEYVKVLKAKDAKFMVLGRTFDNFDGAVKARDAAMESVKAVKMKYIVDGKEVGSSSEVCPASKKAGKVNYVVGEDKTGCEIMARISLAKAQYDAAKKAADQKLAKL